jgi:tetratricopeptide (TPR) repeat protein
MMKLKRPLFPLLMCMAIAAGCDIQERPLTDPVEIYEKAMMHIHEQSFIQAKPLLEKAASLFRETGKTDRLIETLVSLVQIDIKIGEYRPAFEALQEAAALMRKEGDVHGEIRLTLYEGDIYAAAKMFNLAIAKYRGALTSAAAFDDKNASIEAFLRIADLLAAGNDYERALEEYKEALTRAQAMDEYDRMAAALGGIGRIYRLQKRYAEAENSMSQAASLFDRVHDPVLIAQLQMETGILQASQNGVNQALQSFKEAVNTLRRGRTGREYESIILFRLGYLYEQNSRFLDAKRYYGEAIEIAGQLGDCITKNYISFFFQRCGFNSLPAEQQKHDRSRLRQEYEKIAREFQECRHVSGEGYMYIQIGLSYEQEGNYTKANEYYSRAVMIDQNTFVEYSDPELHVPYQVILGITPSHTEWYELLSASLLKLQKSEEALRVLEYSRIRQKACTFRDLDINLRNSKVKRQTMEVRKQIQRAQMLEAEYTARYSNSQYVAGRKEMYALREELEALKQSIRKGR